MSTRATILTEVDGEIVGIYVLSEGYENQLGEILEDNYSTYDDVVSLIECGACSHVGPTLEECRFFTDVEDDDLVEIYVGNDIEDFIMQWGEIENYFFNPDTEEWESIS